MPDLDLEQPDLRDEHYPAPASRRINIFTLGRFSLLRDGKPVNLRAQGKPLELLQVLIALGGRDVSETRISAVLWPDSEGDQAHSAFTTTLSRLRRLLGANSLQINNGLLSLNDDLCWVDCWALERLLGQMEFLLGSSAPVHLAGDHAESVETAIGQLFRLYNGPFLSQIQAGWLLPLRERLRSRFLRTIRYLIQFYRIRGSACHAVISLYEKAREIEPCSEEICRGLMRCHAAHGNRSQALVIFEDCYRLLKEALDIQPSDQTRQLYEAIKLEDESFYLLRCELCAATPE